MGVILLREFGERESFARREWMGSDSLSLFIISKIENWKFFQFFSEEFGFYFVIVRGYQGNDVAV